MPHRFIAELTAGERLENEVYLINQKDLRTTTQGGLYIHAVLVDRTGQIPARMWQATEKIFEFMPEGGFMRFTGRCENYKGNLQFIIDGLGEAPPETVELGDFLRKTGRNIDEMFARVTAILEEHVKDEDVKALVSAFLQDKPLMDRFRTAPAAAQLHHAYIGGLLEHTLNLLELAVRVLPLYPRLSPDLMLAGLLLHDIAKTEELGYDTAFKYTEPGQLIGHVVLGTIWIEQKAAAAAQQTGRPFPDRIKWSLQHIVVSHHGRYEYGAAKLPATPEAAAIHYLDNLDAKIQIYLDEIDGDRDPQSAWTNYNRGLETRIFKPNVLQERRSKGG